MRLPSVEPMSARVRSRVLVALVAVAAATAGACMDPTPSGLPPSSHIRLVTGVPNGPLVSLFVDSQPLIQGLGFRAVTGFLRITAGNKRVALYASGTTTAQFDTVLPVEYPRAYTVVSTGLVGSVQALVAPDTAPLPFPGDFALRVIQASPAAGLVDIYVTDPAATLDTSTAMLEDLPFRGNSEYFAFPTGRYRVRITAANSLTVLYDQTIFFTERAMRTVVLTDAAGGGLPGAGVLLVDY